MAFRDRIKSLRRVRASDLKPSPFNWRTHPDEQRNALLGVLNEVGIADACLARQLADGSLELIDGHLRADLDPEQKVPVLVLDVDDAEAKKLLATLDPLAALAEADAVRLDALLREVDTGSEAVMEMLADLAAGNGMYSAEEGAPPELATGDRAPFRQMTFTVHDSQHEVIEKAIGKAKTDGGAASDVNENSNGNALAFICGAYLNG